jgi:predicted ATP-binding protein involved in virulence
MFDVNKGLKLKEVTIEDYKLFQDFKINFVDNQDSPLPLIVIAGINGTGKTTILEYIKRENSEVIYLSAKIGLEGIKKFLPKYLFQKIFNEEADVSQTYKEVREYINTIFKDLNIKIEFERRDAEGNLFFRNKKGKVFSIDDISTGEKTLLSKILYLYIQKIKNQVILIDEPELSLHPRWQNQVLKLYENFAKENNCQIIIATHSPHIIGSAKNEYIRLLTEDGVIDNFSKSYGLEFSKILTDIMGVDMLRTPDVEKNIKFIKEKIYNNTFQNSIEFEQVWNKLESQLGRTDLDLKLLKLEMNLREKKNV